MVSSPEPAALPDPRLRIRLGDILRLLIGWLVTSLALVVADVVLPGMSMDSFVVCLAATAVAAVLGLLFRPLLVMVTARVGWVAVVVAGLGGQALVVFSAIWLVPGITSTFWSAFLASWIVAAVGTGAAWIGTAGTDDAFTAALLHRRGANQPLADPDIDGVVFVQLVTSP